ncbi:MAG: hypothetical protein EAZ18_02740 [Oscillatoriales cyanobacterium]|nr:MAG: hypothetical protein EAZ18_02740 [Oscillatoriales cyanobacterium]
MNWIESQKLDGESINQAAQRILKEVSGVNANEKVYTTSGNPVSTPSVDLYTPSSPSVMSTMSTITSQSVDKLVAASVDPVLERLAAVEERLGKLSA